jgi:hypothetical protein
MTLAQEQVSLNRLQATFVGEVFDNNGAAAIRQVDIVAEAQKIVAKVRGLAESTAPGMDYLKRATTILEKTCHAVVSSRGSERVASQIVSDAATTSVDLIRETQPQQPSNVFGAIVACEIAAKAVVGGSTTARSHFLDACRLLQKELKI